METEATAPDRRHNLVGVSGQENQICVFRRFFERLEKRVGRKFDQSVRFMNNRDLVASLVGGHLNVRRQTAYCS